MGSADVCLKGYSRFFSRERYLVSGFCGNKISFLTFVCALNDCVLWFLPPSFSTLSKEIFLSPRDGHILVPVRRGTAHIPAGRLTYYLTQKMDEVFFRKKKKWFTICVLRGQTPAKKKLLGFLRVLGQLWSIFAYTPSHKWGG